MKRVKINQFVKATEGQSPLYAFENSLLLGRKQDALRNYKEIPNKNNIQTSLYLQLLENLSFKKSLEIHNDYSKNRKPTDEMNELVIKNARHVQFDDLKLVVEFISKIEKTERVFNALLRVFGEFGLEKQQDKLFSLIVSKNYDLTETFKIMTFCLKSRVDKAEALVNGLHKQGLKVTSEHYQYLTEGFASAGDLQKTRKYFDKVIDMGTTSEKQSAYRALIECCAKRGLQKDSTGLYKQLRHSNLPATKDIYEQLINNQLFTKDTTQALNWFHRTSPSVGMYSALIRVLLQKDSLTAYNYLKDLEHKNIPDELGFALFQDMNGKHPDYFKDHLKFAKIQQRGKIYESIIKQAFKNGNTKLVNDLYTDLKQTEAPTLDTSIIQLQITGDKELFNQIITDGLEKEAQIVYAYSLHQKNKKELFESVNLKQLNSDLMNLNVDLVTKEMIRDSFVVVKNEHQKLMDIGDFFSSPQYELIFDYHHQPETNVLNVDNTPCEIPISSVSEVKPLDTNESMELLEGMPCLRYIPTSSFWGYEFCIDQHLRQYHPAAKVFNKDNQFMLGLPLNEKSSIQHSQEYYIQLEWADGTVCDLNQKPRRSNIHIFCGSSEKIKSIREVSTCFYELILTTPRLCRKPFIPETKVPKIICKLNEYPDRIPFNLVQYFKHQKAKDGEIVQVDGDPKVVFNSVFGKSDLEVLSEQMELQVQIDELLKSVDDLLKDTVLIIQDEKAKDNLAEASAGEKVGDAPAADKVLSAVKIDEEENQQKDLGEK
ncbi:Protein OS-9 [Terramyces sp. JEL0728]|nr:Protein OS-9 [Terramyces sp. JEL0728]